MVLTEEEQRLQKEPFEVITFSDEDSKIPQKSMKVVVELTGSRRESKSKDYEYEVNLKRQYIHGLLLFDSDLNGIPINNQAKFRDGSESYVSFKTLQRRGWEKAAKAIDARIAQRSGQYTR